MPDAQALVGMPNRDAAGDISRDGIHRDRLPLRPTRIGPNFRPHIVTHADTNDIGNPFDLKPMLVGFQDPTQ